jgi:predicted acetyltransferase
VGWQGRRVVDELPGERSEQPSIAVVRVAEEQRPVLRHLIDLYAYDFSEMLGLDLEEDGRFRYHDLGPYWREPWRHPLLVRVDGKLAGFALVHERSRLNGEDGIRDMAEFFILRRYRRQGTGARVAAELFDRFAGSWEIRVRSANAAALAFWRRVVDRYSGGRFKEAAWNDQVWQGPVLFFESGGPQRNSP